MTWYPTPEQHALLGTLTNVVLAKEFGVSEATIRRARSENRRPLEPPVIDAPRPEPGPSELDLAKDEIRRLKAEQRKTGKLDIMEHRILASIEQALGDTPRATCQRPGSGPLLYAPRTTSRRHELFGLLSDWHAGEVVDPAQVSGINTFNWTVLQERVAAVLRGYLSFAAMTPNLHRISLGWLGDMVNGIIHEEIVASNEFPVADQCIRVGELMGQFVLDLAAGLPADVEIACYGVAGNHARTKPGHASKNVFDSWDWVAYHLARLSTKHLENVTWELPRSGTCIVPVAGKRLLLFHGDGIRSSMVGFPAGGVARRANELQAQFAGRGEPVAMLACGHFHDPQVMGLGRVLVNGSLVGMNEYGAKNYGGGAKPCQLLATFDSDRSRLTSVAYVQA
jgi:hypothetical protein